MRFAAGTPILDVFLSTHSRFCGQWADPLDLYGKRQDIPALHESPSYELNSWCQHGITGRMSLQFEDYGQKRGSVPGRIRWPRVRPGERWAPPGCHLPRVSMK